MVTLLRAELRLLTPAVQKFRPSSYFAEQALAGDGLYPSDSIIYVASSTASVRVSHNTS